MTPIQENQAMQTYVRQRMAQPAIGSVVTPHQPLNDWESMLLSQMEKGYNLPGGLGYQQRQAVPEDLLKDLVRRKYQLGPTADVDLNDYVGQLRTFENSGREEFPSP